MTKIVYNACYGGFGISDKAKDLGRKISGDPDWATYDFDLDRTDPILVEVVEALGSEANGLCAKLVIVELKPGTKYRIEEYDGYESISTEDTYDWDVAQSMKSSYEYDMDPRYGWVCIDTEGSSTAFIMINNKGYSWSEKTNQVVPVCSCNAWEESECCCSHLPYDYWI